MSQVRPHNLEHVDFDQYVTISEREERAANVAANDAFIAAMTRASARGREKAKPGTFVDPTPPVGAKRFRGEMIMSACGSPARLCTEVGARGDGAQTMK